MTVQISAGYWSDSARTKGEIKTAGENIISITKEMPGGTGETTATLASNTFTPVNNFAVYVLDTEAAAATDVLDHIATTNVRNGQIVGIRIANNARTITIDHGAGGAGQILTADGFDVDMIDTKQILWLKYNSTGTSWELLQMPTNVILFPPGGAAAAQILGTHPTSGSTRPILRALAKEHLNTIMDTTLGWKDVSTLNVSSNVIIPTRAIHKVNTSGGAQTVNTIDTTNMGNGRIIFISASSASNALTIAHESGSAGTGRVTIRGAANLTFTTVDQGIWLVQESGDWREIDRCGFNTAGLVSGIVQGRLTTITGEPLKNSNGSTGSSTLYFTPYKGNKVSTFNGSDWTTSSFTEKSLSVDTLKKWVNYDIFLVDGTHALEALAWKQVTASNNPAAGSSVTINMNDTAGLEVSTTLQWVTVASSDWATIELARVTAVVANTSITVETLANSYTTPVISFPKTRATAVVLQDGQWVKSGATTRLYLGTIRPNAGNGTSGGKVVDYQSQRYVFNAYNPIPQLLRCAPGNVSHTYTSTTPRPWNNDPLNWGETAIGVLTGLDWGHYFDLTYKQAIISNIGECRIGLDSVTGQNTGGSNDYQFSDGAHNNSVVQIGVANSHGRLGLGFHFFQMAQVCATAATVTFYGAPATSWPGTAAPWSMQSGIHGWLQAA